MLRRNSDDRLRELERLVLQGDQKAAIALLREETRRGEERDYSTSATFLVDTPLGQVAFTPVSERDIYVEFGGEVSTGSGDRFGRPKVQLPPLVINRVPHRGNAHFLYYDEAQFAEFTKGLRPEHWAGYARDLQRYVPGFAPYSVSKTERGNGYNYSKSLWLRKADRNFGLTEASSAAERKFVDVLVPIVNRWAADHKREMLEAEIGNANNEIRRQQENYRELLTKLDELEAKLAELVIHEVQVKDALRRGV